MYLYAIGLLHFYLYPTIWQWNVIDWLKTVDDVIFVYNLNVKYLSQIYYKETPWVYLCVH